MTPFQLVLLFAALLCSLVAGFLFAFAAVVMPGIRHLDDGAFIRAFQVIDGVIQKNQPLFILVWVGSVLGLVVSAILGVWNLGGVERLLLIIAALVYVLGVQMPTMAINIPLNNRLQKVDVGSVGQVMLKRARDEFERRWNQWNVFRTVWATIASMLLLMLLLQM